MILSVEDAVGIARRIGKMRVEKVQPEKERTIGVAALQPIHRGEREASRVETGRELGVVVLLESLVEPRLWPEPRMARHRRRLIAGLAEPLGQGRLVGSQRSGVIPDPVPRRGQAGHE